MRLFSATLATETNTFSPLPTSLDAYREAVFLRPGEHPVDAPRMCTAPLFVARRRAAADGFTLIEGSCFAASPAGTTNRQDYEFMRDEILGQLKAALPVDASCSACTAPWWPTAMTTSRATSSSARARSSGRMRDRRRARSALPHDGQAGAARRHHRLLQGISSHRRGRARRGPARPRASHAARRDQAGDVALRLPADQQLPDDLAADARLRRSHQDDGGQGRRPVDLDRACFPYADVPELERPRAGGDERRQGARPTRSQPSSARSWSRCAARPCRSSSAWREAVAAALAFNGRPVVMAEPADNAGGGAPSDNTAILRHLIEREVEDAAVGPIWDPVAVRLCFDAGRGRHVPAAVRRQDRADLGHCRSTRMVEVVGARPRLLAEFRADQGAARRLRGGAGRRRRGRPDHQAHAGARARALHQSRNRSAVPEARSW